MLHVNVNVVNKLSPLKWSKSLSPDLMKKNIEAKEMHNVKWVIITLWQYVPLTVRRKKRARVVSDGSMLLALTISHSRPIVNSDFWLSCKVVILLIWSYHEDTIPTLSLVDLGAPLSLISYDEYFPLSVWPETVSLVLSLGVERFSVSLAKATGWYRYVNLITLTTTQFLVSRRGFGRT